MEEMNFSFRKSNEQELLDLHKQVITAPLDKDASFFTKNIADDLFLSSN